MRFLYTTLFVLLLPFVFLRLWKKGKALPEYRLRWHERRGKIPKLNSDKKVIWFHTVSVGEFIAAIPLIRHYANNDRYDVVVTTMTPTGSTQVQNTFKDSIYHCYLPYDLPLFINRFLKAVQPSLFICLETELWPNLIHACKKRGISVALANARLSEKSAKGYRRFHSLTAPMLNAISLGAVQNREDAQRLIDLGLPADHVKIMGNIKFDLSINEDMQASAKALKAQLRNQGEDRIWIAASTHLGEDEIILEAYTQLKRQNPQLKLMLVPRHPERFDNVFELCKNTGFSCARRSEKTLANADILLCDTMGELLMLYGAADFAFVGGSLVENGGHNYIEAAAWALPVLSGPSTFNFRETAAELNKAGALDFAQNSAEMAKCIQDMLDQPEEAAQKGQAGKNMAEKNRGALATLIQLIDQELEKT